MPAKKKSAASGKRSTAKKGGHTVVVVPVRGGQKGKGILGDLIGVGAKLIPF